MSHDPEQVGRIVAAALERKRARLPLARRLIAGWTGGLGLSAIVQIVLLVLKLYEQYRMRGLYTADGDPDVAMAFYLEVVRQEPTP